MVFRPTSPHGFCPICTNSSSQCSSVPLAFGGSFGGKIRLVFAGGISTLRSFICAALVSLWAQISLGSYKGAEPRDISNNFYFPVSSCMPWTFQPAFAAVPLSACTIAHHSPCCREKRPCLGDFQPHRHHAHPITMTPEIPRFAGILLFHNRVCLCGIFLCR